MQCNRSTERSEPGFRRLRVAAIPHQSCAGSAAPGWGSSARSRCSAAPQSPCSGIALAQIEAVHDRNDAIENAANSAELLVQVGLQPHVTRADMDSGLNPSTIDALDGAFQAGLNDGRLARIKLWSPDGKVLYSDQHELIGQSFDDRFRPPGSPRRRARGRGQRSEQSRERRGAAVRPAVGGLRAGPLRRRARRGVRALRAVVAGRQGHPGQRLAPLSACWPPGCSFCGRCCSA